MKKQKQNCRDLLAAVEHISSVTKDCKLDLQSITNAGAELEAISEFLSITEEQSILFSCLTELGFQKAISLDTLAKHFDVSILRLIKFLVDLDALEDKNLIIKFKTGKSKQHSYNDVMYTIPFRVIEALRKADASCLAFQEKYDLPSFLQKVVDLIDERSEGNIGTETVLKELEGIILFNRELPFVSYIDDSLSHIISKFTAFAVSCWRLKQRFDISIEDYADALFDDFRAHLDFEQQITDGTHELMKKKILKLSSSEFDIEKSFALSETSVKKLYLDYPSLLTSFTGEQEMLSHLKIADKKLYFNSQVNSQLKDIGEMLKPSKFKAYCRALKKNNYTMGVTAIFYGEPGTGKTEAVYQLARKTGRDIFMVDLSRTKSKWFGESEKVVRQIFTDYETLRRNRLIEPILFINEADGLFGSRMPSGGDHTSTDQTVNTIQNILLQSMEIFEGILIVTTNLAGNLDKAFERRFFFRLEFTRPDAACRRMIWKSKLPELTAKEAELLGEKFRLTGGDIDVKVRQALMNKILKREGKLFKILDESCMSIPGFRSGNRVGF